jgi:hypothetical protein
MICGNDFEHIVIFTIAKNCCSWIMRKYYSRLIAVMISNPFKKSKTFPAYQFKEVMRIGEDCFPSGKMPV